MGFMSHIRQEVFHQSAQRPPILLWSENILLETLRLYPVFPHLARAACQDTVLPVGCGPHQDLPIFVPKDTIVVLHYYTLHRDETAFGHDVDEFRPRALENC
jgi:cytochrome P450